MKPEQLAVMHWGTYRVTTDDGKLTAVSPVAWDSNPSRIGQSLPGAVQGTSRVRRPAVREGFLKGGAASREGRGREPFVEVSWEQALTLVADELTRVKGEQGNAAIYGGSYGWSSAGRFHHAQSQLHRFLNLFGGYTGSTNTYSIAAGERILPHILGDLDTLQRQHTHWPVLAEHCQLFVAIGGLPLRNAQVNGGGANDHALQHWLQTLRRNGTRFINISPVQNDLSAVPDADWLAVKPGSDTALLLALCQVLIADALYDQAFVDSHTVGFAPYRDYLFGRGDGVVKSPEWAESRTGLAAGVIRQLAHEMARHRTMINIAWSVQRARQGEQTFWATVALTALLGQIGTPGGGLGFGYASTNLAGADRRVFSGPRLPQGRNPVEGKIPVARFSDMLLHPGEPYEFDGQTHLYPDIRFVYWAGGNVFHHHQDLNKLVRAWRRPETILVHEQYWTAQAKFADIVLPATTSLEREDIGSASNDGFMIAMRQHIAPFADARDDYAIFSGLAARLGFGEAYTEGRDARAWLEEMYEQSRPRAEADGIALPAFDAFWQQGVLEFSRPVRPQILLKDFRDDPLNAPLATPSGKIELFSQTIADFGYEECPGHPYWHEPEAQYQQAVAREWPLHLLSSQPRTRLHSQYDHGSVSRETKIAGREPLWMHPYDAAERDIHDGEVVKVFNTRGALLAGVKLSEAIRPGVVQMSTGAWYDPQNTEDAQPLDKHGNPNVLTEDRGSSRLGQGCSAQSCRVDVVKFEGPLPAITAWEPPVFVTLAQQKQA
ncbi:molybdopterin-dependent oxidoreductase [Phytobacter diazotrophicus]|uniref:molybdopterin-dependent oxidoreductase n=1 Tax=Phytobacter diazotrophicus TaxID=395631 RepID=UPI0013EDD6D8|nr:molybdopterin-dependent oxidoreductase [Phytobacter diazotrophicus]MDU7130615.1 molybdopterin-dependent oxidoreductase [Enterobacteriaceae bacterium]QIH61738.1 Asp-tRNA(Asn)/Glu-tRNA(Gln) amidotransferase GatCAB subunit C [Enterobacteriaceae bacterium A-F18]